MAQPLAQDTSIVYGTENSRMCLRPRRRSSSVSMAWPSWYRPNTDSNADLVDSLSRRSFIRSPVVAETMLKVDRKFYSPENPYTDAAQSIGFNATISAPHMHALALEELKDHLKPGMKALDVGCGSGLPCFSSYIELRINFFRRRSYTIFLWCRNNSQDIWWRVSRTWLVLPG